MNIVLIQAKGKHLKNENFREILCFERAFKIIAPEHNYYIWGQGFTTTFLSALKPDVIFVLENYDRENWIPDLSKFNCLKIFWCIDAHCTFARQFAFCKKHKFNIVLHSTAYYVNKFKPVCKNNIWFPNCYDNTLIDFLPNVKKQFDVGFCGNLIKDRKKWLDTIDRYVKCKRDIFIIGDEMVKAINSYKIHWNKNYSIDLNYRTFETLGCKTCLLTNQTNRIDDLFTINKHLFTYNTTNDCIDKIKFLLNNEKIRLDSAQAGYLHVKSEHTYKNRANELLKMIASRI